MLGPYTRALSEILTCSERNRDDVIPQGYSLTIYGGCTLSEECVNIYKSYQNRIKETINNENQPIREFECVDLPGFTTMTESFKIAFEKSLMSHEFAQNQNDLSSHPVIFILTIKDPSEMRAFRLNNHVYSAYPDEMEVVL